MSINCFDYRYNFFNKFQSGRLICSIIIILFSFIFVYDSVLAQDNSQQEVKNEAPVVNLSDADGDGLQDAIFENKDVKIVISSKNGCPNLIFFKGEKFNENIYPPQVKDLGYVFRQNLLKAFEFDNAEQVFSKTNYNIEIEKSNETEVVIKATANISLDVNDNTPDYNSVSLIKRYYLPNEGYNIRLENSITNLKEKIINLGDDKGSFSLTYGPGIFMDPYGPVTMVGLLENGGVEQFTNAEYLNEKGKRAGSYCGIALKDQYFSIIIEFDNSKNHFNPTISAISDTVESSDERKKKLPSNLISCILPSLRMGPKDTETFTFNIYAGPLILKELEKINRTKITDYGWLVTQMLEVLRFFYSLIPNYGIAIILLTLLVRLILYPLTLRQVKEMAKMQRIQPKLKEIQDKYRDDPQKMNEEALKLYTKHHVNPLGGCLPLFLQLPIIMALFNTFRSAVELRKASFLWMNDLSKGDPYLILPIAIAALMYYQQGKTNIDPQQRQMMAFMPMMMLVFTFSLPSGVLVYWFASSILGILQQLQTNHYMVSMKEEN